MEKALPFIMKKGINTVYLTYTFDQLAMLEMLYNALPKICYKVLTLETPSKKLSFVSKAEPASICTFLLTNQNREFTLC